MVYRVKGVKKWCTGTVFHHETVCIHYFSVSNGVHAPFDGVWKKHNKIMYTYVVPHIACHMLLVSMLVLVLVPMPVRMLVLVLALVTLMWISRTRRNVPSCNLVNAIGLSTILLIPKWKWK